MSNQIPNPGYIDGYMPPPKAKKRLTRSTTAALAVLILVAGILLGFTIGSRGSEAPGAAQPAPAETVTVEVPAPVDAGCAVVAEELYSMLALATEDVMIEQNDIMIGMIEAFSGFDVDAIESLVPRVEGVTATVGDLTDRLAAVKPEYERCVNP